jgi:hypothetical protein
MDFEQAVLDGIQMLSTHNWRMSAYRRLKMCLTTAPGLVLVSREIGNGRSQNWKGRYSETMK